MLSIVVKARKKGKVDKPKPPTLQERLDVGFSVLERMEQRLAHTGNILEEIITRRKAHDDATQVGGTNFSRDTAESTGTSPKQNQ